MKVRITVTQILGKYFGDQVSYQNVANVGKFPTVFEKHYRTLSKPATVYSLLVNRSIVD